VVTTTTWTAIRTDRAVPAAHGGATLAFGSPRTLCGTTKQRSLVGAMGTSAVTSAYVAEQESNPPREESG